MFYYLTLILLVTAFTLSGAPDRVFMHVAPEVESPPVIDGKLDDPCWSTAPVFTLRTPPNSKIMIHNTAETQTTIRMVHDRNGIYTGIICKQENLDSLKATVKSRDGGKVWEDDSVELFFSPLLSKINYYKFDINSLGVFSDFYRYDAVLTYNDWNALNVKVVSGRLPDAWMLEFFVSWQDLATTQKTGDFIGFQMTRFMWKGAELHVNGSTGGNYGRPNMAYVYLSPRKIPPLSEIAPKMNQLIPTEWYNLDNDDLWIYSDKKKIFIEPPPAMEKRFRSELNSKDEKEISALDRITDSRQRFEQLLMLHTKARKAQELDELEKLLN